MALRQLLLLGLLAPSLAFDYNITGAGDITLTDVATGISPVLTPFADDEVDVVVDGLEWTEVDDVEGSDNLLHYRTFVNGKEEATGSVSLEGLGRSLPSSVDAGTVKMPGGGRHNIEVLLSVDISDTSTSAEFEAYGAGVAIIPLLVVLVLAVWTNMVELSLYTGIFVGSCMVAGELNDGFKRSLETYLVGALADGGHAYVYLFSFFLSGMVGMMEKSGGMLGFTKDIAQYAKTAQSGMLAAFCVGLMVFFDDYANCLLSGKTLRPLMDSLSVSREKLAFMVDATAAPVASVAPVSSWVGFEVGLIEEQIDRLKELVGDDLTIDDSGFSVFLQSLKYRYYPWLMLVTMITLIVFQREFGPMLIAERKTEVYRRTDGGEGGTSGGEGVVSHNSALEDQPLKTWNMIVPIIVLVILVFYCLVQTGDDGTGDQSVMDKIENSDSYAALLWSTMGASAISMIFYMVQIVKGGALIIPNAQAMKEVFAGEEVEEGEEPNARFLMSVRDSVEAFLVGMGRIFPAAIVLTLAWASGSVMVDVGCDRLFANWITGGIDPELLPTLSFIISLFMALATGTSWGTMSILFPLILVPTYQASNGDEDIFYATVAGVLSGSVAGDHMSPISDTTVLSSLSTECGLMEHVTTQTPYVLVVVTVCVLLGTLPVGYDVWPNIISYLLGIIVIVGFAYVVCKPTISATGDYDIFTNMYLMSSHDEGLEKLKEDTVRAFNGEDLTGQYEGAEFVKELHDEDPAEVVKEEMEVEEVPKDDPQPEVENEEAA